MFIFIRLLSDDYGHIAFLYRDNMYISKIVVQARNDKLNNAQYSFLSSSLHYIPFIQPPLIVFNTLLFTPILSANKT